MISISDTFTVIVYFGTTNKNILGVIALSCLLLNVTFNLCVVSGQLLHRQEHDSHRRHEGGPTLRRLLHPANPQVRGAEPRTDGHQNVKRINEICFVSFFISLQSYFLFIHCVLYYIRYCMKRNYINLGFC
jgi:hypothetical protein